MSTLRSSDDVTSKNVARLQHLTTWSGDTPQLMDIWIKVAVRTIAMLPPKLRELFFVPHYQIGDSHFHMSREALEKTGAEFREQLGTELAAAAAAVAQGVDLSGRPEAPEERISALLDRVEQEIHGSDKQRRLLEAIREAGNGEIRADAAELIRLYAYKRPTIEHQNQIARRLGHIRAVLQGPSYG